MNMPTHHVALLLCLVAAALFGLARTAGAAQPVEVPVTVLGLTIGQSTEADVQAMLREQGGQIIESGTHPISDGLVMKVKGNLGLEGLTTSRFGFSADKRLQMVILTMGKHRFDPVLQTLRKKYTYVSGNRPFVGDRDALLRSGDVEIVLAAPHMSFEMHVIYSTQDMLELFLSAVERAEAERQRAHDERL